MEFVNADRLLNKRDRINKFSRLVSSLPSANYTLLRVLTDHLIRIVRNSEINKMTLRNIGMTFCPTLGIPPGVLNFFITEFDHIFTDSVGIVAPKTIEATPKNHKKDYYQSSTNDFSPKFTSNNQQLKNASLNKDPTLPPKTALREEITGRSKRNGVYYMDNPDLMVRLKRKLTVAKSSLCRNDDSSEEEINDLALQVEDDAESVSSASVEEFVASPPPNSSNFSLPPRILEPPFSQTLAPSLQLPQSSYYETNYYYFK
ncbi:23916_t:CDS:1 [Racocetra persica]|uniref:23916_t:CDS:1 n=1 Tax=Racocetra persica TaxID=160502 RepID=A0ACA9MYK2_9GLOM|nr:23916_t:CDS:1 [Racocetra persica]